jgi:hypothetical protein
MANGPTATSWENWLQRVSENDFRYLKGEYILVPCVHELVVPVAQAGLELPLDFALLWVLHLQEQEGKLLAEGVQAFPPDAAAVLIYVADEDFVQQVMHVQEHRFVVRGRHEERSGGERGWRRSHFGGDGHCRSKFDELRVN